MRQTLPWESVPPPIYVSRPPKPRKKWVTVGGGQPTNYDAWLKQINPYLEDKIGVNIDVEVISWGDNTHGQASVPASFNEKEIVTVYAGFYQNYAVTVDGDADAPYYRPLGLDGEPKNFLKAKPQTDRSKCTGCGVCAALCPMGSISREDPAEVTGVCIKCHACVRNCPTGAKYFDDEAFLSHKAMLERDYTRRAEDKLFL